MKALIFTLIVFFAQGAVADQATDAIVKEVYAKQIVLWLREDLFVRNDAQQQLQDLSLCDGGKYGSFYSLVARELKFDEFVEQLQVYYTSELTLDELAVIKSHFLNPKFRGVYYRLCDIPLGATAEQKAKEEEFMRRHSPNERREFAEFVESALGKKLFTVCTNASVLRRKLMREAIQKAWDDAYGKATNRPVPN